MNSRGYKGRPEQTVLDLTVEDLKKLVKQQRRDYNTRSVFIRAGAIRGLNKVANNGTNQTLIELDYFNEHNNREESKLTIIYSGEAEMLLEIKNGVRYEITQERSPTGFWGWIAAKECGEQK